MALTVKRKIWLGTLFLFLLLLITGGVSIFYVAKLKSDAGNILQDNYESLLYCHTMQQQLDSISVDIKPAIKKFAGALQKEQNNITEPGEKEASDKLESGLQKLEKNDTSQQNIRALQEGIQTIFYLNMQAIKRKNLVAETSAGNALTIIISLSGLVFIMAFTFLFNFPSIITNPIGQLIAGIREITNKNYRYRIHIESKDEFGKLAESFNNMAERLEYFESSNLNQILFEKSRAEAVINSLKDASIGIDKNNIVLFANQQALQLLGLRSEQLVGKPVDEVKKGNDLFKFLSENESSAPFKIVIDNWENYFIKEVLEVEQGDIKNKVIVLKNITSFKELDVAKTNFIATISHELKTPLAASDFSLKLLEDERVSKLTDEQKEWIQNLKADNRRMLTILSELLNLTQVEAGKIQLNISKLNPQLIVTNAVQTVMSSAMEKGVRIVDCTEQDLPSLQIDADKTTWVLNNFLTNAIKYSFYNSEVKIKASIQNGNVEFSVRNQGQGIAKEYLPRLFERYYQVPGSKEKGNGLGLAISKEIVEAQGGSIRVESEIGKDTVFYVSFPVV